MSHAIEVGLEVIFVERHRTEASGEVVVSPRTDSAHFTAISFIVFVFFRPRSEISGIAVKRFECAVGGTNNGIVSLPYVVQCPE